jgi:2-methylcitrate dehydratase PrpD
MEITRALAEFASRRDFQSIPGDIRHQAERSLVNWMGCALGGSRHETMAAALAALSPFAGAPQATVIGRRERMDSLHAALVNGMSAHVLDFDDTHLRTLLHPSVPVASSLLALAERRLLSGTEFLHAFIIGAEIECRLASAIYAGHNVNWYITGTAGVIGAAAAAGCALELDARRMAQAFGIAATQAAGLREMAGTMCKSFVHGRAAQNGLLAALLAQQGFTSSERAIEAPRGFAGVLAPGAELKPVADRLGEHYEFAMNTYKPHACGVVCHPAIDGCLRLRAQHGLLPRQIASVFLRVHPMALTLTGVREPASGLESKWSIYHSAAVVLCDGAAGEAQYTDARVADPEVAAVRGRVSAEADATLREDEAHVAVTLADGRCLAVHVEHALGSVENPMSDADLDRKFLALAEDVLPPAGARALLQACWQVGELRDAAELARRAVP